MKKWMYKITALLLLLTLMLQPVAAANPGETLEAKSNLPQIYITVTQEGVTGSTLTKDMGYVTASIQIVDPTGEYKELVDAGSEIKIRGNSTANGAKKPYNFKLSSKKDVLGMGKGKKWCLLANMFDKSLIRNYLVFNFAKDIGMAYTPDCKLVDVWVDGKYVGNYLLCEPVEANSTRVDIDVDGGDYLIEFEKERNEADVTYIKTKRYGIRFAMQDPETLTPEQTTDITNRLNAVEDAIASNDFARMEQVMDMDSFVNLLLVEEYFKEVDCDYSSVKFYFKGDKLYAGPVWDYDLSSGNASSSFYRDYNNAGWGKSGKSYEGLWASNSIWFRYLVKNNTFMDHFKDRYQQLRPQIENLYKDNKLGVNKIDQVLAHAGQSFTANWAVWPITRDDSGLERKPDRTFDANVAYLRTWLEDRNNWMIQNYNLPDLVEEEPCPSEHFVDVPGEDNWAHKGIDFVVERGLMVGVSDTEFDPNGTMIRAQLVTILYRAAGSPAVTTSGTFTDVPAGTWYTNAVEWAASKGIVSGTGDGLFSPDQYLSREQIAAILYRYSGSPAVTGDLTQFADAGSVSAYAVKALTWATGSGILTGTPYSDGIYLEPAGAATRAQVAAIMMRYLAD